MTRVYLVAPAAPDPAARAEAEPGLGRLAAHLSRAGLSAVFSSAEPGTGEVGLRLRALIGLESPVEALPIPMGDRERSTAVLGELARRCRGQALAVVVGESHLRELLSAALGAVVGEPYALDPPGEALVALDWPAPGDPAPAPRLAGLDLDWLPPRDSAGGTRYPGGPRRPPTTR